MILITHIFIFLKGPAGTFPCAAAFRDGSHVQSMCKIGPLLEKWSAVPVSVPHTPAFAASFRISRSPEFAVDVILRPTTETGALLHAISGLPIFFSHGLVRPRHFHCIVRVRCFFSYWCFGKSYGEFVSFYPTELFFLTWF